MHETMTMEKFENSKKMAESVKMTQAILGQSQEKGNATSVFKTEIDRESYLYTLSLSESAMDALKMPKEQVEAAKANIRSEVKDALAVLKETSVGGTALNYKKREAALKVIDDLGRAERMRQQAEMFETLKKGSRSEKVAPATASLSPDQINTQARMAELKKAAASATVQNNTPEDMTRIAELDAATKTQRLSAKAAKDAATIDAYMSKKTVVPAATPISADEANTQTQMAKIAKAEGERKSAMDTINTKSLETLTSDNNAQYENAVKTLTAAMEGTAIGSKERKSIESLLGRYGSARNLRDIPKADKLENERAFARALMSLEAQK